MHPTLFTVGNWNVPTYTVLLDLGLVLGLVLAYLEGRRQLGSGELGLDLGLWAIIGGVIGGRIGYVLANWSAFQEEPIGALRLWEGGLSFHGGVLGGLLVLLLFALLRDRGSPGRVTFWQLADSLTLSLGVGIVFGWAACLLGGCAYGALGEGFGYAVLPDLFGISASRFATQAVALGFSLLLLAGFWLLRGHWPFRGASFLMYSLLYFSGQIFLEFTRGDEAIYVGPWRLAQIIDLGFVLAAAVALLVRWWRPGAEMLPEEEPPAEEEAPTGEGAPTEEGVPVAEDAPEDQAPAEDEVAAEVESEPGSLPGLVGDEPQAPGRVVELEDVTPG